MVLKTSGFGFILLLQDMITYNFEFSPGAGQLGVQMTCYHWTLTDRGPIHAAR